MKRFRWGIAAALACMLWCPAAYAVDIDGPDTIEPGSTVQITVTGSGDTMGGDVYTEGLIISDVEGGLSTPEDFVVTQAHGAMRSTYTCIVTAGVGLTASFRVRHVYVYDDGMTGDMRDEDGIWSRTVADNGAQAEVPQQPTEVDVIVAAPADEPIVTEPVPTATAAAADTAAGAGGAPVVSQTPGVQQSAAPAAASATGTEVPEATLPKTADASVDLWVYAAAGAMAASAAALAARRLHQKR